MHTQLHANTSSAAGWVKHVSQLFRKGLTGSQLVDHNATSYVQMWLWTVGQKHC